MYNVLLIFPQSPYYKEKPCLCPFLFELNRIWNELSSYNPVSQAEKLAQKENADQIRLT
jgi:hypothetical protein